MLWCLRGGFLSNTYSFFVSGHTSRDTSLNQETDFGTTGKLYHLGNSKKTQWTFYLCIYQYKCKDTVSLNLKLLLCKGELLLGVYQCT